MSVDPPVTTLTDVTDESSFESGSTADPLTVAVLVNVCGELGASSGIVIVAASPDAIVPRLQVMVAVPEHVPRVEVTAPAAVAAPAACR